ncbi:MAG: fuconolactone hydrolase [Sphingomonas taxi]|uniref:Fuconolactone hydrolase n=1 Tax=Sphingomonas taxi TaxID=1549858 RepID=A0A2W5P6T7_9SPHN|nr:MAG: fuconolactone hydrolase [Sphingomonas taxi]
MRIDAHHHLWRYDPAGYAWIDADGPIARDFTAGDLAPTLAANGMDAAIAVQARQVEAETRALLDAAARCPAIVGVVGWIDLRAQDIVERLAADAAPTLCGYRHMVQDEVNGDFLLDAPFVRGIRAVAAAGLSYDLLVDHRQLATVPALLDQAGEGRFILDHAAKPAIACGGWQPWAERIAAVAACPQVMCKVSGLVTEADHARWRANDIERYLDHVFALFGPERLIWGSDWPVCLLAASYADVLALVEDYVARHCPESAPAIFGGNALCAYAIAARMP